MRLPYFRFKWIEPSFGASIQKREERPVVVAGFALCTDALSIQFCLSTCVCNVSLCRGSERMF